MELQYLKGNNSVGKLNVIWIFLFIITSFFTIPSYGISGSEDVTMGSQTTGDTFTECDPPCNGIGFRTLECVDGSCECTESGYVVIFNTSVDGYDCIDNDECNSGPFKCDQTTSYCENTEGSYSCICKDGHSEATVTNACKDIDECSKNSHNCDVETSTCKNTLGSYECKCKTGYSSDGRNRLCTNIDECLMNPPPCDTDIQNCTDTIGSFVCTCLDGTTNCDNCRIGSLNCLVVILLCGVPLTIIAVILIVVMLCVRRSRKIPPSPTKRIRTADVELVDPGQMYYTIEPASQGSSNVAALLIRRQDIRMDTFLVGEGMIEYYKAMVTLQDQKQNAMVKKIRETASSEINTLIMAEVQKLSLLPKHAYILELLGWCDTAPPYFIFEFIHGSSLLSSLREGHVQVPTGANIALQVARGMKFLSENEFLHPGLRADKILFSESGVCKLYDFVPEEIAVNLKNLAWNENPPYQWMSPEYLFLGELTRTGDVWSFGIFLWEFYSKGEQPFGDKDRLLVQKCIRQENPILTKPQGCPGGIWTLILQCWEKRPEERAVFQHLSTEFFLMTQERTYEL